MISLKRTRQWMMMNRTNKVDLLNVARMISFYLIVFQCLIVRGCTIYILTRFRRLLLRCIFLLLSFLVFLWPSVSINSVVIWIRSYFFQICQIDLAIEFSSLWVKVTWTNTSVDKVLPNLLQLSYLVLVRPLFPFLFISLACSILFLDRRSCCCFSCLIIDFLFTCRCFAVLSCGLILRFYKS